MPFDRAADDGANPPAHAAAAALSAPPAGTGRRLDFIDAARGVAVLLVFLTHSTESLKYVASAGGVWLTELAYNLNFGRIGVVTFFAVSGFLIPSSLRGGLRIGSIRFLISRSFRLYPAFWLSVMPAVVTLIWMSGKSMPRDDIWLNFTMLPRFFGAQYANAAYWTLEVEVIFYGLCLFLFLGKVIDNSFVLSSLMFFGFFIHLSSQMPILHGALNPTLSADAFFLSLHLSCMFWGAMCRQWWDKRHFEPLPGLMFGCVTLYWLAWRPITSLWTLYAAPQSHQDTRLVAGYALGLLIFFVLFATGGSLGRVVAWVGRISYSFYLLQGPAIFVVTWIIIRMPFLKDRPVEFAVLLALLLGLAMSQISYSLVERPCIRVGHRLAARLTERWGAG